MSRKRDAAQVQEARRLYLGGMTRDQVGQEMGVDGRTVGRWLADVMRPKGRIKRADVTDERIRELMDEGLSLAAIGREVGMTKSGVQVRCYALTGRARLERVK